jgi:ankyrin repeat protein
VVRLLVERDNVEADSKDRDGQTLLSLAAERGHEAVVRLLVERDDVDPDSRDDEGRTTLFYAAERGHEGGSSASAIFSIGPIALSARPGPTLSAVNLHSRQ